MPEKYKRKAAAVRGNWSEESLKAAFNAVKNDYPYARQVSSRKTLERIIKIIMTRKELAEQLKLNH